MKTLHKIAKYLPTLVIVFLSVVSFVLCALPVWNFKGPGVYFEADPDFVYLSNAILYIKSHQIFYIDHPGTPAIRLLAFALTPFRFYAKFVAHEPFVVWYIHHQDTVYLFARLFQAMLVGASVFIALKAIKLLTKSILSCFLLWSLFLIYSSFLYMGSSISAESTNFLLLSLTLYFFSRFYISRSPLALPALSFMSGLALANRLTNSFVVLGILCLSFSLSHLKFRQKLYNTALNSFFVLSGFMAGTWSIRRAYPTLFNWVFRLASTSGLHGGGERSFMDFFSYTQSLSIILDQQKWPIIVLGICWLISIYFLVQNKRKQFWPLIIVLSAASLGSLVFAKYPLPHYHFPNYLLVAFVFTFFFSKVSKYLLVISSLFLLISVAPKKIESYSQAITTAAKQSITLQNFVDANPHKSATVWEWARSRDFALLWGRSWTGGYFDQELALVKPDLWELDHHFEDINTRHNSPQAVFSACWDKLYIQQVSAPTFLEKFPNQNLSYKAISNTTMALITSTHCK